MEIKKPVRPYRVQYMCDQCGEEMTCGDTAHPTSPVQSPYKCKNGHKAILRIPYPYIVYEEEMTTTDMKDNDGG